MIPTPCTELLLKIQVLSHNMVIGKIADQIDRFTINFMHAVENVQNCMLIAREGRIKEITPIALKINRCVLSYFNGKIGLDVTEELLRILQCSIFEAKITFIVKDFGKLHKLINNFRKEQDLHNLRNFLCLFSFKHFSQSLSDTFNDIIHGYGTSQVGL